MKFIKQEMNDNLDNILSTFNGEDGGIKFLLFKKALVDIEEQAVKGDDISEQVLNIVTRFSRLIDVLSNPKKYMKGNK